MSCIPLIHVVLCTLLLSCASAAHTSEHFQSLYQHDIAALPATNAEQQDALSVLCDVDNSGRLSAAELQSCTAIVVTSPPHDVSHEECIAFAIGSSALRDSICGIADMNGDGVVSREEYASVALPQMSALMESVHSVVAAVPLQQNGGSNSEKILRNEAEPSSSGGGGGGGAGPRGRPPPPPPPHTKHHRHIRHRDRI